MPLPKDWDISDAVDVDNLADYIDEDDLNNIGKQCVEGYDIDEQSRYDWIRRYEVALKLASQVKEAKSWPWPKASNVKFPAMTIACLQFHAKAYPALVPSRELVNIKVIGRDYFGIKSRRAERLTYHMNYQLLNQMEEWDEHMDKLLITLPITGTEFKKTYYDSSLKRNVSRHVHAKDLVVNYWSKSLESAYRKTEILELTRNEIKERVNQGIYLDVELGDPVPRNDSVTKVSDKVQGLAEPQVDGSTPYQVLECHTFYDMDDDGYDEPYIITVEKASKKVLRIVARFQKSNIKRKSGKIVSIKPDEYYTKFSFIPSPDGGFYDMGFGTLIGPLNEAINTLTNQLIDAGTLSTLQSGFISRAFRAKGGSLSFEPGEWKVVNATGQDIKDGLLPLPMKEPSATLFQLLTFLVDFSQRVTSTTDMMVGENPGQNQKATTTMAVMEQGQKVFTAIFKRIRRALAHEFKKLFFLNQQYMDDKEYFTIVDPTTDEIEEMKALRSDYETELFDIAPTADPNAISPMQKITKAQAVLETVQFGANLREALKRYYDALEIENPEALLPPDQPPPPDPEVILKMRKEDREDFKAKVDTEIKYREQDRKEVETGIKEKQVEDGTATARQKIAADVTMKSTELALEAMKPEEKDESKPKGKSK